MNGMAFGGFVSAIHTITGADRIVGVEVDCEIGGKWGAVMNKVLENGKELEVGDEVVVFLPDALVPKIKQLAFMEKHRWRVKMMRLKGYPSEVLAIPRDMIIGRSVMNRFDPIVGEDLTENLGVEKYEKPIPEGSDPKGNFPIFIPKTDETNFQRADRMIAALVGKRYYATVKYDGTSQTFYHRNGVFGGCSRNLEMRFGKVWEIIEKYDLMNKVNHMLMMIREYNRQYSFFNPNSAIQWECVGPGIQGNPLRLTETDCRVFSVYDIDAHEFVGFDKLKATCLYFDLPMVEVVETGIWENWTADEIRAKAVGTYPSGKQREGIVIRPMEPMRVGQSQLSFKVINLDYKEKD